LLRGSVGGIVVDGERGAKGLGDDHAGTNVGSNGNSSDNGNLGNGDLLVAGHNKLLNWDWGSHYNPCFSCEAYSKIPSGEFFGLLFAEQTLKISSAKVDRADNQTRFNQLHLRRFVEIGGIADRFCCTVEHVVDAHDDSFHGNGI
jgi:hypothetical protein